MKVLQIYNDYRSHRGGEAGVVYGNVDLFEKHGIDARLETRTSKDIHGLGMKVGAFRSGIYSRAAYNDIAQILSDFQPDIVHAHNLYPLFSPSVLVAARDANVPVTLTVHNYGFACPHWAHLRNGRICEKCVGGKEHWCVINNCRDNILESMAYAARSAYARKRRFFHDNVNVVMALTQFARNRLIEAGFSSERVDVVPNMTAISRTAADASAGQYVAFAGRLSKEKGADTLLLAARKFPEVPVQIAGRGPQEREWKAAAPANVDFVGLLDDDGIRTFYRNARCVVVPSKWFEMCPLVILEAMSHGIPVIASRIGGLPEMVIDGETGLLFDPGNAEDLARKIQLLWEDDSLCRRLGQAARRRAEQEYSEPIYYERLTTVYKKAIRLSREETGPEAEKARI